MKKIIYSLAFSGGLFLLFAGSASADTTGYLPPSSDGAYLQWSPSSGSTHYVLVDESVCNGNTDRVSTNIVGRRDSYGVSLSSIPDGALITQIEIKPCASKNKSGSGSSTLNVFYRFNGSNSADAGNYVLSNGTTPAELTATSFSGLSLAKDALSSLETGAVYSAGGKGLKVSRVAVNITYTILPVAPSNLAATTSTSSLVTLMWADNSNNEDGFKVERGTDGVNFSEIAVQPANSTVYFDGPLAPGLYYYRVRAFNAAGNSGYSNTASATVLAPPLAPSNLTATTSTSSLVTLMWADNSNNEDGFKVERGTDGVNFSEIAVQPANSTVYFDGPLAPGLYYYRVRAFNAAGNSGYSNTAIAYIF